MKPAKIIDFLISVFFTKQCKFCNTVIDIREDVCEKCKNNIVAIEGAICMKCGYKSSDCICGEKSKYYMSVCAPYYYEGGVKTAIKLLKFHNNKYMAKTLAKEMAKTVTERYGELDFDLCTFVPAHKKEQKQRGYNQAQLISQNLSRELGITYCQLLEKTFQTVPQHSLSQSMRSGNLLGAIALKGNCKFDIKDKRILICDDVKTTGSTLDECAKTLLVNGAAEVRCIAACIVKKSEE
jgi:ComF family protein